MISAMSGTFQAPRSSNTKPRCVSCEQTKHPHFPEIKRKCFTPRPNQIKMVSRIPSASSLALQVPVPSVYPAGTRRNNNVFTTSIRRRVDVVKTLSLCHYCVMCPLGYRTRTLSPLGRSVDKHLELIHLMSSYQYRESHCGDQTVVIYLL